MTTVEQHAHLLRDEAGENMLASALLTSSVRHTLPALMEMVAGADFYNVPLGQVWEAARGILDEGKRLSRRSLLAALPDMPHREQVVGRIQGEYVPEEGLEPAARAVREAAKWRKLQASLHRSIDAATTADSYEEAMEFALGQLAALGDDGGMPTGPRRFDQAMADWWDWMLADPEDVRVFPTPWESLNDKLAGGLHSKRSYIVAGRPGGGKTLALLNMAAFAAEAGRSVLVFSIEMPEREIVSRVASASTDVEYGRITKREIDEASLNRLAMFGENRAGDMELYVVDSSNIKIEKIRSIAKAMKNSVKGLDVLMIDHVGLVRPSDSRVGREQQVAHISWMCSLLAKELDCAVVIAAQLNRGPENDNTPPKPSDLRESGSLEQNADIVALLHHEKINGLPTGEVSIILGKNRTGPRDVVVPLPFRPHFARIG